MPSPTILLVDDTSENLKLLITCLEDADLRVAVAQSGEEALERAVHALPELILLDVMMPGIDGFETCRRLKANPELHEIPVIFMTVISEITDKVEGFNAGGIDYIVKPFQPEEVVARVKIHLTIRQLQQQLQAQNIRLHDNNARLQVEIDERTRIEAELKQYRDHLQELVDERTRALQDSNSLLQQQIAERIRVERELRISDQQYRALAENVADGIAIIQAERFVFINPAFCAMLGYEGEQMLTLSPSELWCRDDAQWFHDLDTETTLEQGLQLRCLTSARQEIWTEQQYRRVTWESQPALLVTVRDITAEKSHEQELEHERARLEQENISLRTGMRDRYKFGDIIGRSAAMQDVYEAIARAAASDTRVLICGESGTGKELVARAIHALRTRKKHDFVPVNCGAVPETLFEREFFGHRKGAFTTATMESPGYFDQAHQGTLFLDEVAELPPTLQVKLLRALESNEYTPIGASKSKHADVRIMSATNKDLRALLRTGEVREDFFYRIRVIVITLPPLRERREDIPLLVEHFLAQYGQHQSRTAIPGKIMDALCSYHWPGNVRELQNELQRYLAEQRLEFIGIGDPAIGNGTTGRGFDIDIPQTTFQEATETFEKTILTKALLHNAWHRGNTAKQLDIPTKTLYNKIKKYGLEHEEP